MQQHQEEAEHSTSSEHGPALLLAEPEWDLTRLNTLTLSTNWPLRTTVHAQHRERLPLVVGDWVLITTGDNQQLQILVIPPLPTLGDTTKIIKLIHQLCDFPAWCTLLKHKLAHLLHCIGSHPTPPSSTHPGLVENTSDYQDSA
jgi:hypothetical protein